MPEADNHDGVFKPFPNLRNLPFLGLRFIRLRYIFVGVLVWNVAFVLTQRLGGAVPLDQSPERLLSVGILYLAFAACCFAILFAPSIEVTVLAKPEGRRLLRRDLWMVAATLLVLGVTAFWNAARALSNQ